MVQLLREGIPRCPWPDTSGRRPLKGSWEAGTDPSPPNLRLAARVGGVGGVDDSEGRGLAGPTLRARREVLGGLDGEVVATGRAPVGAGGDVAPGGDWS